MCLMGEYRVTELENFPTIEDDHKLEQCKILSDRCPITSFELFES